MNYLYGDSTPSPLKSNFLEFLRDALDFLVFVLQANDSIARGKEQIRVLRTDTEREMARLERFVEAVSRAVDAGEKGADDSPTSEFAVRLSKQLTTTHRQTADAAQQRLDAAIANVDAEESATRAACKNALATLLKPHDPHEASMVTRIALAGAGYDAKLTARHGFGLEWSFALVVPSDNLWRAPVRIDSVVPHLEIRAPQVSGWISKEVKVRPQKLDRYVVTELVDDGAIVALKLRAEAGTEAGFDLEFDVAGKRIVRSARVGPAEDAAVGDFDPHEEDAPALLGVVEKLRAGSAKLERGVLDTATFDGTDFASQPTFGAFVERFVAMMTPIARAIAERSLTSNELVIRRALGNDRREEIFVPHAALRQKYATLSSSLAAVFAPLGLDRVGGERRSLPAALRDEPQPIRAELAPSRPPPPLATPVVDIPRAPSALAEHGSEPSLEVVAVADQSEDDEELDDAPSSPDNVPTPLLISTLHLDATAVPATKSSAPSAPPAPSRSSRPVTSSISSPPTPAQSKPPRPASPSTPAASPEPPHTETSSRGELASAMKKVATLLRAGQTDEAYAEYATLLSSPRFGEFRPEDQRQALRYMIFAKNPPSETTPAVLNAHRAAVHRLQALVSVLADPRDYELLGAAQLVVGDRDAARATLAAGLDIERTRNPESDLSTSLLRRLATTGSNAGPSSTSGGTLPPGGA